MEHNLHMLHLERNKLMNYESDFYTLKGYQLINDKQMTSSMEDYLEMICRMLRIQNIVRINELAEKTSRKTIFCI